MTCIIRSRNCGDDYVRYSHNTWPENETDYLCYYHYNRMKASFRIGGPFQVVNFMDDSVIDI